MSENKKKVVVYSSKTGYTKIYADWIAQGLKCEALDASKVKVTDLSSYDTIIYGGGIYASSINGAKLITKNYNDLKSKKLIIFAVGSSPVNDENTKKLLEFNIPEEQRKDISFYYLRGGFDYNRLSPFSKFMMTIFKSILKKTKNPTDDQKEMIANFKVPQNYTKKENIEAILQTVQQ